MPINIMKILRVFVLITFITFVTMAAGCNFEGVLPKKMTFEKTDDDNLVKSYEPSRFKKIELNKRFEYGVSNERKIEVCIKSIEYFDNIAALKNENGAVQRTEYSFINGNYSNHEPSFVIDENNIGDFPMLIADCEITNLSNLDEIRPSLTLAGELKEKGLQFIAENNFHNRADIVNNTGHGFSHLEVKEDDTVEIKFGFSIPKKELLEHGYKLDDMYIATANGDPDFVGIIKVGNLIK